jgi:hypothetical protein
VRVQADVRPAIHFDSDHNFFVHLNGSKKFVLFPPWEWENLYLYPRIHPSWHKSQLSFDAVPLETYPNAPRARAYEVGSTSPAVAHWSLTIALCAVMRMRWCVW